MVSLLSEKSGNEKTPVMAVALFKKGVFLFEVEPLVRNFRVMVNPPCFIKCFVTKP